MIEAVRPEVPLLMALTRPPTVAGETVDRSRSWYETRSPAQSVTARRTVPESGESDVDDVIEAVPVRVDGAGSDVPSFWTVFSVLASVVAS